MDRVKILNGTYGIHGNGVMQWPVVAGGLFAILNSDIAYASNTGALGSGGHASVTSKLLFKNCRVNHMKGYNSPSAPCFIRDDYNAPAGPVQITVENCYTDFEDYSLNPATSLPVSIFSISDANVTLNIVGGKHSVVNNNSSAAASEYPVAVNCTGGKVNVEGGAVLEATGSTISGANQGTGIYNNGGIVSVRAGCRVKGDTSKAVNNVAGTVNVSPNADTIGGTTGVITATAT